ncbi:MAG TPA: ABC-type transport auxiliary lipoprotein family protein [Candidatus Cloacimonadota bacterium]|nr:ABC-type transport auxiliary lipoprotein family protein [Candidatus Cloacimonadota bacterium]
MKRTFRLIALLILIVTSLISTGCFPKIVKGVTKYYVLDYLSATELSSLRQNTPKGKTLEVLETTVARAYSRNQIVVRKDNFQISYLPNDVWATRLSDAVPNLLVERIRAYNIFQKVGRDTGEANPSYYLETNIQNLEMIEEKPVSKAYVKIEFILRDSSTQRVLFNYLGTSVRPLPDTSPVYLVQVLNELIMAETDVFAAKCITFLDGKEIIALRPANKLTPAEAVYYAKLDNPQIAFDTGELLVPMMTQPHPEAFYYVEPADNNEETDRITGVFGQPLQLEPGDYIVTIDDFLKIKHEVKIKPQMRTVIDKPAWAELTVMILDESHNLVRLNYDIYKKKADQVGYDFLSQGISVGDDEIGELEKVWILTSGQYMIKLGGGPWSDLRDFTIVDLLEGESKLLTVIVDPAGEGNFLLGAGVLGDDGLIARGNKIHSGAVHTNITLSTKNSAAQEEPVNSFTLNGQFENSINYKPKPFEYSMRSLYDLGMNLATGDEFRITLDGWSLKNTVLFVPIEKNKYLKNFGLYGRTDLTTHFFGEKLYFTDPKNLILKNDVGDVIDILKDQNDLKTQVSFFPLRVKEGTGITYRFVVTPKVWFSIRGGFGWQQEFNNDAYTFESEYVNPADSLNYLIYREGKNTLTKGLESTMIFSAQNIFRFLSINSTFDVLFPIGKEASDAKYESDNRINFRILRNISIDIRANLIFDKEIKDYILYDYSSFLRLSLFY